MKHSLLMICVYIVGDGKQGSAHLPTNALNNIQIILQSMFSVNCCLFQHLICSSWH